MRVAPVALLCFMAQLSLMAMSTVEADDTGLSPNYASDALKGYPSADFVADPSDHAKVNQSIILDASGSRDPDGQIVQYNWRFGDGRSESVSDSVISHTFLRNGTFEVVLTVVDNEGLSSEPAAKTLTILPLRPPVAYFELSREPFPPNMVVLNASGSYDPDGSIVSYIWNFGDGSAQEELTEPRVTHRFELGLYNVTLTVVDDDGLRGSIIGVTGTMCACLDHFSPRSPLAVAVAYLPAIAVSVIAGALVLLMFVRRPRRMPGSLP